MAINSFFGIKTSQIPTFQLSLHYSLHFTNYLFLNFTRRPSHHTTALHFSTTLPTKIRPFIHNFAPATPLSSRAESSTINLIGHKLRRTSSRSQIRTTSIRANAVTRKGRLILVEPGSSIELITRIGAGLQAKLLKIRISSNRRIAEDMRQVFRRQIVIADMQIPDAWLVARVCREQIEPLLDHTEHALCSSRGC